METKKAGNPYNTVDLQQIGLWVGALALVVAPIGLIWFGEFQIFTGGSLFVGIAAISMNLWPYIGMQQPTRDERSARVGAMAGLASWYITLIVMVVGAAILGYLPASWDIHPTLAQGLGGIILVMVLSMVLIYEYMIRKSDAGGA